MRVKSFVIGVGMAALAALPLSSANAATVGFDLTLSGSNNVPTFTLQNTSDVGFQLLGFTFTIGDTSRHFDFARNFSGAGGIVTTLNSPDTIDNGLRADLLDLSFVGFDAAETLTFGADVDLDPTSNSIQNFNTVFFNNGTALNSVATALFTGGVSASVILEDNPADLTFSATNQVNVSAVPVPAALPLLITGLGAIGLSAWRRKRRS